MFHSYTMYKEIVSIEDGWTLVEEDLMKKLVLEFWQQHSECAFVASL